MTDRSVGNQLRRRRSCQARWGAGSERLLGNVVMLGACLTWSGYNVAVRMLANRLNLAESSAYALLVGTALLVPFALLESARVPVGASA